MNLFASHYLIIKQVHVTCVILSISLFALRGVLQVANVPWRRFVPLRVVPHVVDSVLLLSAILLATTLQQYPFVHGWLTAKVVALFAYILIGKRALAAEAPERLRPFLLFAALVTAFYIIGVAVTHSPSWRLF